MTESISRRLARFGAEVRHRGVPEAVAEKVATHLLDVVGVQLAASRRPFAASVVEVARRLGGPCEATGIGIPGGLAAPNAALLNGTLAHGVDYDDTHLRAIVHPSATVMPAALAVAEEVDASGETVAAAIAAGLETAVRVGLAAEGRFHERGLHATPIAGVFGATVAASVLYGHDAPTTTSALGLAASMAGGLLEFLADGSSAKRLHGGWAAHSGVLAARLAGAGLSGPAGGLDGRFGLLPALFGDLADPARIGQGLGESWELLDIAVKPYPCCHFIHAFLDVAADLRRHVVAEPGAAATVEDLARIESIECAVVPLTIPVVCEPRATKLRPQTAYDAQFSLPFSVALMFVRGRVGLDDYAEREIRDPRLISLAERVRVVPEPRDEFPRRFPGRLRLVRSDGETFEGERSDNRGGPGAFLSWDEVAAKFRNNALPTLGGSGTEALLASLADRRAPAARSLMPALRATATSHVARRAG